MKIVLLGSGNVATHLGHALKEARHEILQVWSRTRSNAAVLGEALSAAYTDNINALDSTADIYILSVKDDAIAAVASSFPFTDKLLSIKMVTEITGKDGCYMNSGPLGC